MSRTTARVSLRGRVFAATAVEQATAWWRGLSLPKPEAIRTLLSRRETLLLAALFGMALLVRLVWISQIDPAPEGFQAGDPWFYHESARNLLGGRGYIGLFDGEPTAKWAPGYTVTLAALYAVVGESATAAKVLNALLGSATALFVVGLGWWAFNRQVGFVAGFIFALFPNQIFFSTLVMSETLFLFLLTGLLLLLALWTKPERGVHWYQAAALGVIIGATSYVRGELILFPLVLGVVWLAATRQPARTLALTGLAMAMVLLTILPWTVRNAVELDYPVLISTGSGENLLAGHWAGADGTGSFIPGAEVQEKYQDLEGAELEIAAYQESIRRAASYAVRHPLQEVKLTLNKLYAFYRDDSSGILWIQRKTFIPENRAQMLEVAANGYYFAVLGLAMIAVPLWFRLRDPRSLLLIGVVVYFSFVFGVVFVAEVRHHFPVIPVLSISAAVACVRIWEAGRAQRALAHSPPLGGGG